MKNTTGSKPPQPRNASRRTATAQARKPSTEGPGRSAGQPTGAVAMNADIAAPTTSRHRRMRRTVSAPPPHRGYERPRPRLRRQGHRREPGLVVGGQHRARIDEPRRMFDPQPPTHAQASSWAQITGTDWGKYRLVTAALAVARSEEHTSELQSRGQVVC